MPEPLEVFITPMQVRVNVVHESWTSEHGHWALHLERFGSQEAWMIRTMFRDAYSRSGEWDWTPRNSDLDQAWIDAHTWPYEEALEIAKGLAQETVVNGHTARDIVAKYS